MKTVVLAIVVWCMPAVWVFAQETVKTENPNAPEITFEKGLIHDFGTIEYKGKAEYDFVFTNTGKEPLIITSCSASCGCTTPTCPKDQQIKPGEKGTVKVRYNNTHISGSFTKTVTIISNAKPSSVTITIKGVVAQKPEAAVN